MLPRADLHTSLVPCRGFNARTTASKISREHAMCSIDTCIRGREDPRRSQRKRSGFAAKLSCKGIDWWEIWSRIKISFGTP